MVPYVMEKSAQDLADRVRMEFPLLELACGTGVLSAELCRRMDEHHVITATDLSPDMISVARRKRPDPRVQHQVADMEALPFDDASFASVACQYGVMFTDPPTALAEVHRVLRPGGHFAFNVWDSHAHNRWIGLAAKEIGDYFGEPPVPFYDMPFWYHDPDVIRGDLETAGFHSVEIEWIGWTAESPTARKMATMMVEGISSCAERAAETGSTEALKDRLTALFSREFGEAPMRADVRALIVQADR